MIKVNVNTDVKDYIEQERSLYSRAKYIVHCVKYVRDHKINIYDHYESGKELHEKGVLEKGKCKEEEAV